MQTQGAAPIGMLMVHRDRDFQILFVREDIQKKIAIELKIVRGPEQILFFPKKKWPIGM